MFISLKIFPRSHLMVRVINKNNLIEFLSEIDVKTVLPTELK